MTATDNFASDKEHLPYNEITDPKYAQLAAETFVVEEPEPGILLLRGPCPRCGSIIDVPVVNSIYKGGRSIGDIFRRRRPTSQAPRHVEPMMCLCDDEHPDRPEGRKGCGAYWTFLLSPSAG